MLKERDLFIRRVMIAFDALIISLVFLLTFFLRKYYPAIYKLDLLPFAPMVKQPYMSVNDYLAVYFFVLLLWCIALFLNGMYRSMHIKSLPDVAMAILKSVFWVTIAFSALVFLLKLKFISRLFFIIFMFLTSGFLLLGKIIIFSIMHSYLKKGYNHKRLLVMGTSKRAKSVIDTITGHPEWGYDIVKVVDYAQCLLAEGNEIKGCEVVQTEEEMRRILVNEHIDEVIFVVPRSGLNLIENYIYVCEGQGVDAAIAADFFNLKISKLRQTDLDGTPLITLEKRFDKEWQIFVKRGVDIVISGLGIVLLSPFFLLIIILIRLTSPGPAFFLQERVSLHGRKFTMYKFRSMYQEAEQELKKLLSLNEVEGPIFKIKNDPRITPVGRFLRKFSIDELPQLFNVFVGRMSLVGPRPALPREVEQYAAWERRRLSVRPGITCLWQAYHRGEKEFKRWMETDLEYVDNWTLTLDFKILLKTIIAVLTGKGAC